VLYNAFNWPDTPKSAPSRGGIYTACNAYSLGPPGSASQTASESVQLFLHSSRRRVPILY